MVAWRNRPKGGIAAPFGLGILACVLMPHEIGYQELAAFIARQAPVAERGQSHGIASPFGTIHARTLNLPRPISAALPVSLSYALSGLDSTNAEITGSIRERLLRDVVAIEVAPSMSAGVTIERRIKGDRLAPPRPDEEPALVAQERRARKGDRLVARTPSEPDEPAVAMAPAAVSSPATALTEIPPAGAADPPRSEPPARERGIELAAVDP